MATGYVAGFTPPSRTDNLFSAFFQDEIRLSGSVWLTLGGKLEHNPYTGIETEPSARLVWSVPGGRQAVWAAASKALRQPARSDTGIENTVETLTLAPGELQEIRLQGNPHVQDEQLRDYELGYRAELAKNFSLDAATFLSFYHNLETLQPLQPSVIAGSPMQIIIPLLYANGGHAVDYGGELSINWNATSRWRISPGYSYLHATLRQNSAQDIPTNVIATDFPQNMVQVRSQINLTPKTQFDQSIYYTARLPGATIPGHARFDLRLSRRLSSATEVSIVGQNLLRPRTMEYGNSDGVIGAEAVRSIYGKITWRF
jgi:iron complex outermembrane receptor protein